uniref:Poly(A) RNA polymerase gld-2 homolog B-like isoform X2 n=1 Tax=Dermatophagoides pteronyssinus TaxID=6956 RepID=A0A6P6XQI7_DERPT|nr:poly(A) RNA polymerase gld-2 homolog B-like isoform X2 [Dermatophagoides pteronyssinus]
MNVVQTTANEMANNNTVATTTTTSTTNSNANATSVVAATVVGGGGGNGNIIGQQQQQQQHQQPSVTLTIRLIMQGKEVGSIIGKKGDNIKKFREESGAKITISDGSCPERIVTVTGSTESILKAFAMIARKFEEDANNNSTMGMGTNFNISNTTMASSTTSSSTSSSSSNGKQNSISMPVTLKLIVPASQCGSLIGKGGSKIKEIREITGASIQVASEMLPNSTERAVTLSGSADSITKSIYQICCVMLESPPKGPTIPYRPKPAMPPVFFAGGQAYTIQGQFAIPHPDAFNAPPPTISSSAAVAAAAAAAASYFDTAAVQSCALQQHFNQLNQLNSHNHPHPHHHQHQHQHHYNHHSHHHGTTTSTTRQLSNSSQQQQQSHFSSSPQPPNQLSSSSSSSSPVNHHQHQLIVTGNGGINHHHQGNIIDHHQSISLSQQQQQPQTPSSSSSSSSNGGGGGGGGNSILNPSHTFLDISTAQYSPGFLTKLHRLALQHAPLLPGQAVGSLNPQATLATLAANTTASMGHHGNTATTNNPGMVATLTTEMTISNDIIGSVIGKGGSKINEIRQLSGATIKINSSEEGTKDRTITISGTPEAINLAQYLIATSNGLLNNTGTSTTTNHHATAAAHAAAVAHASTLSTTGQTNSLSAMAAVAAAVSNNANKLYTTGNLSKHNIQSITTISNGSTSKSNKNDRKYAPY